MATRPRQTAPGSGQRRNQVIFECRPDISGEAAPDTEDMGNDEGEFEERFREWAAYQFLRGGETVQAQRMAGVQPLVVTIPKSKRTQEITPAWRCQDAMTLDFMNIRSISENADNRNLLDLLCEIGVAT